MERPEYPSSLLCPITNTLMNEPVMAADGFTYDRSSIPADWMELHCSSPATGADISTQLFPNIEKKNQIVQWLAAHPMVSHSLDERQIIDCCFFTIAWANSSHQVCSELLSLTALVARTQRLPSKQQLSRMQRHLSAARLIWCPEVAKLLDNLDAQCQTLARTLNCKLKGARMAASQAQATVVSLEEALTDHQQTVQAASEEAQLLIKEDKTRADETESAAEVDMFEGIDDEFFGIIDVCGLAADEAFEGWTVDTSSAGDSSERTPICSPESIDELSMPPLNEYIPEPSTIRHITRAPSTRPSGSEPATTRGNLLVPPTPRFICAAAMASGDIETTSQRHGPSEPSEVIYRPQRTSVGVSNHKRKTADQRAQTGTHKRAKCHGSVPQSCVQQAEQHEEGEQPAQPSTSVCGDCGETADLSPALVTGPSTQVVQIGSAEVALPTVHAPDALDASLRNQPCSPNLVVIPEPSAPLESCSPMVNPAQTEAKLELAPRKPLSRAADFASRLCSLLKRSNVKVTFPAQTPKRQSRLKDTNTHEI